MSAKCGVDFTARRFMTSPLCTRIGPYWEHLPHDVVVHGIFSCIYLPLWLVWREDFAQQPVWKPGQRSAFLPLHAGECVDTQLLYASTDPHKNVILFGQLSRIITDLQDAAAHGKVATRVAQTGVHILPGFPPQRPQLQDSLVRKAFKWCFQPYLAHIRRGSALGRNCATASAGVRVHTEVGANPLTASFNSTVATNPCRAPRRFNQLGFRV